MDLWKGQPISQYCGAREAGREKMNVYYNDIYKPISTTKKKKILKLPSDIFFVAFSVPLGSFPFTSCPLGTTGSDFTPFPV